LGQIMRALLEKVALRPGESFACRTYRLPRFDSPWHFHPECELTLIESSHGLRFVGDSIERFEPGDLVLLGRNLPHYWSNPPEWRGPAGSLVIQFPEELLGPDWLATPEFGAVRRLLRRAERGLRFAGRPARRAAEQMRALAGLAPLPRLLALLELLHELAAAPARPLASAGFAPVLHTADAGRLGRVLDYVNAAAAAGVQQREAARRAGLSPAAFSRYFRKKMGRTFEAFVNEVRVGRICRALIEEPEHTVAQIAYAAGYNSLANFNRQFRRRTGLAPVAYRAQHGS
jgi:AraC-like DNA-binding protein